LASASWAILHLQNGEVSDASKELAKARNNQNEASSYLSSSTFMLSWYAGLKSESIMVESIGYLTDALSSAISYGQDYRYALAKLETYTESYRVMSKKAPTFKEEMNCEKYTNPYSMIFVWKVLWISPSEKAYRILPRQYQSITGLKCLHSPKCCG